MTCTPTEKLPTLAASPAGTGYVVEAERPGKSRRRRLTLCRGKSLPPSSLAEQIVESGHDAVAAQPDAVAFRRPRHDLRSVDVVAAAEIGVHEFQAERELARQLDFDAATHRPAGIHRGSLRDHAQRVVANAGLDVAGGEAAFDIGQPRVETVANAAGHGSQPGELGGPNIGRGEIRAGETAIEVGSRYRALDAENEPVVLKIVTELPAADHSAPSVARQRIQRRKERRSAQISPAHAVRAVADLASEIEDGPTRGCFHGRGAFHIGKISGRSAFDRRRARAADGEYSTDAEKHMPLLLVAAKHVRQLARNIGESAASVRSLIGRVNKLCAIPPMAGNAVRLIPAEAGARLRFHNAARARAAI